MLLIILRTNMCAVLVCFLLFHFIVSGFSFFYIMGFFYELTWAFICTGVD